MRSDSKKDVSAGMLYIFLGNMENAFWEGVLWGMGFRRVAEEERKKRCRFCRRLIPADSKFCPYCGRKLTSEK